MSEDLSIRITSVFTLAGNELKNVNDEIKENLICRTERDNSQALREQLSTEGESGSFEAHVSSKKLMKLAAKHNECTKDYVTLQSKAAHVTSTVHSNSTSEQLDTKKRGSNASGSSIAAIDEVHAVFRVATGGCPSFCCRYNPVLVATLRAKVKALKGPKVKPKSSDRSNISVEPSSS